MSVTDSARAYVRCARNLSKYWERPLAVTAFKLVVSRLVYDRGPDEFDSYRFINKPLREWNEYTTEEGLNALQSRSAPPQFRYLEEDKLAFAAHCAQAGLRTVPTVAVIAPATSRRTSFGNAPTARSAEELARIFAATGDFDGFAKPVGGGVGFGAFAFTLRNGAITTRDGTGTARDFFDRCVASAIARDGYLLQPRVHPHPALLPLMPGPGLGTVRAHTFLQRNGDLVIPWAWIKMPVGDAECDNLRFGPLVATIDVESGVLRDAVGVTAERPVVHAMKKHPVSGVQFADITLPYWPDLIALLRRATKAFEMLPALGWDIAIVAAGPVLVETNVMFGPVERGFDHGHAAEYRRLFAQVADRRREPGTP